MMKRSTMIAWLCITITFLVIGILGISVFGSLMKKMVSAQTILTTESPLYKQWLKPDFIISLQFFFFNLTNPSEFELGARPIVSQIGPYTYREKRFKTNVSIDNTSGLITYKEVKQYTFDRNLSIGSELDEITSVNLGYISVANASGAYSWSTRKLIIGFMKLMHYKLCVRHSVKEMLWGYDDPVLAFLHKFDSSVPLRIGLYLDKNDTDDGLVKINSGLNNPLNVGKILEYHGKPMLSCWKTPQANMINGSDGSLFHGLLQDNEAIDIFSADICRSIRFSPVSQDVVEGIPVKKYLPMEDTFDSVDKAPQNLGFCLNWPNCLKDGVMELSTCKPKAPIVASLPHLTHADPSYQSAVVGLHPSEEFNTTLMIQPTLGAGLQMSQKLQLNAMVKRNKDFVYLANVTDVFLPIVFLNESVHVDKTTASQIRLVVVTLPLAVHVVCSLVIVLSVLGIGILLFLYYRRREQTLLENAWNDASVSDTQPIMSAVA